MKFARSILLILFLAVLFMPIKIEALDNTVNLYLFYSKTCPHCKALEEVLVDIEKEYNNLKVYKYEVSENITNVVLMENAASELGITANYVPLTIIGTKPFIGYSGIQTRSEIEYAIKLYSSVDSYKDLVGQMLNVDYSKGTLTYDDIKELYSDKDSEKDNYVIDIPFIGPVNTKTLSLPVISILIGTIDGFNPCAMWVLLFLLSILINMKDRRRMWILGFSFLITSAVIYLLFMVMWLNLTIFIGAIWWVKMLIATIALIGGYINVKRFIQTKDAGCEVVDEKKRKKIFANIKKITSEKSFSIALIGIITLAISVNFIELTCSAGLPVIFTNILASNNLSPFSYAFYLFLYIIFFLIDDLIVFFLAMTSLRLTGISNKYAKYSHLIGGIIMIIIGLLMIFKPEWLMFNF